MLHDREYYEETYGDEADISLKIKGRPNIQPRRSTSKDSQIPQNVTSIPLEHQVNSPFVPEVPFSSEILSSDELAKRVEQRILEQNILCAHAFLRREPLSPQWKQYVEAHYTDVMHELAKLKKENSS